MCCKKPLAIAAVDYDTINLEGKKHGSSMEMVSLPFLIFVCRISCIFYDNDSKD